MSHAEQTVNLLRRALRLVVERQLGRDLLDQGYVVARRRRRGSAPAVRGRAQRAPEPGLEALALGARAPQPRWSGSALVEQTRLLGGVESRQRRVLLRR